MKRRRAGATFGTAWTINRFDYLECLCDKAVSRSRTRRGYVSAWWGESTSVSWAYFEGPENLGPEGVSLS